MRNEHNYSLCRRKFSRPGIIGSARATSTCCLNNCWLAFPAVVLASVAIFHDNHCMRTTGSKGETKVCSSEDACMSASKPLGPQHQGHNTAYAKNQVRRASAAMVCGCGRSRGSISAPRSTAGFC